MLLVTSFFINGGELMIESIRGDAGRFFGALWRLSTINHGSLVARPSKFYN